MKTDNLNPDGARAGAIARGLRKPKRADATMLVRDSLGTEVLANEIYFGTLTVADDDDGTAIISGAASGSGTGPTFDVTDPTYGAIGDGTTVDCAAINLAIAAVNAAGGGVLYFPRGSYLCDSGLDAITVPCLVTGDGYASVTGASYLSEVIFSSATANGFEVASQGVAFQRLGIRNTNGGTPSAGAGVVVTSGGMTAMVDCLINGFWINLDIQEGGGYVIDRCWFVAPVKYAVKIRNISSPDGGDQAISNCWFYAHQSRTADAAIRYESAGGLKITNCKVNFLNASGAFVRGIDLSATVATTSIMLVHGNSFENVTGDSIHVETSGVSWDLLSIVGNQFGHYSNTTGNAIEITCANLGEVDGVVISANTFRQSGGGTPVAVALTKVNDVTLVGNVYESGFAGGNISTSGCTNVVNLDLLGATPSGELGGTWDAITVDATHSGSAHLALGSTSTTAAAGDHTHSSSVPPAALLESGHATPFTFDEWLQASDGSDVLWASA